MLDNNFSNNRRIAKNTLYLYVRTALVLLVSLYTSRVLLQVLGVDNLGIYNVVGGIVAFMSFLQVAQSKATSRFITFEIGKNSAAERLRYVFSICMTIHILLALAVIVIGETAGLYIIDHWTDIPVERHSAAIWVYQFALLMFCIQIVRVPYDSVIIANENMSVFAYLSILEVFLQLGLVFCIKFTHIDALIMYAGLMSVSTFIIYLSYYFFVRIKYPIYGFSFVWDKLMSKKILSFSGWTLFGAGANTATQQGVNLLMNNFVGLVANAALGFAGQVNIAVGKFVGGFGTAFTPQIVKLYAQDDKNNLNSLIFRASKFSFALCFIIAFPLIINMDYVLHIWLGNDVPQYTAEFCRMILMCTIIDATTGVYNTTITATGNIKAYQILISISFSLDLLFSFILLKLGVSPALVFGSRIATRGVLNMLIGLYFMRKQISFDIGTYFKEVILKIVVSVILTAVPVSLISSMSSGLPRLLITGTVSVIIISLCTFLIIMTKPERRSIVNKLFRRDI